MNRAALTPPTTHLEAVQVDGECIKPDVAYGNAVTPPVAEVLMCALVECIQGHEIDWQEAA